MGEHVRYSFAQQRMNGLYRLRHTDSESLLYIGEGVIAARLAVHLRRTRDVDDVQGRIFNPAVHLECSWVINAIWVKHERLELECDLIGSQVLITRAIPTAQFLG